MNPETGVISAAEAEGSAAWDNSARAVECPYRDDDGEGQLRQAWLRGYYRQYPRSNAEWGRRA